MKNRRLIKNFVLILFIAVALLTLTGCPSREEASNDEAVAADVNIARSRGATNSYELSRAESTITNIEIVSADRGITEATVAATINRDLWGQFLKDLYALECYMNYDTPSYLFEGTAYRITYKDGSYEVISAEKSAFCNINSGFIEDKGCHFDKESFSELEIYGVSELLSKESDTVTMDMIQDFISGTNLVDGEFLTDNETPLSEYQLAEYELGELQDYFGRYAPDLEDIVNEDFTWSVYTPMRVNMHFPIRCVRSITLQYTNGNTVTRYYTVYKVKEGGYFYVFWNIQYEELRICYAGYLPKVRSIEDFDTLIMNESCFDDVYAIDPSADFRLGSLGVPHSYHLLTTGELLKIEYKYSEFGDTDDLIVVSMTVLPEDNDTGFIAQVYESDLPK